MFVIFRINVPEDIGSFNITVIRHKGNFGNVYAFYYLNRLTASADDFDVPGGVMAGGPVKIAFANGERERNITVYITNDNITETDEQFELGLTIQNAVNNGGVKIGRPDKALVTIIANDDANGVLRFAERSITQNVTEPIGTPSTGNTATFYIERNIGYFGTVNLQWRVLGVNSSADVTPINGLITFEPNVREKNFQVSAVADNIPELKKTYIIQISIVSGIFFCFATEAYELIFYLTLKILVVVSRCIPLLSLWISSLSLWINKVSIFDRNFAWDFIHRLQSGQGELLKSSFILSRLTSVWIIFIFFDDFLFVTLRWC